MSSRAGQKVVCVDASPAKHSFVCRDFVTLNQVYTVRGADSAGGVLLEEIVDHTTPFSDGSERGWRTSRFRPVVERKTDISIFTEMLKPSKVKA